MAYNEVQVGRYIRFLQKFLSMKAREPADMTVAPELMAAFSLFHGTENRYLEGWARFGIYLQQAAGGAGTFAKLRLHNPKTSNVIAVIEKMSFTVGNGVVSNVTLSQAGDADLATVGTQTRLDARGPQTGACVASRTADAAAQVGVIIAGWANSGTINFQDCITTDIQEIPLLPGDSWQMQDNTGNIQVNGTFWWRERFLEESERT